MADYKILLVDDSPLFLRQIKGMLAEKYDVEMATSADKALIMLERVQPDLILLDYEMPGTNGRDFLIKLRKMPGYNSIPVIFLTAVADKGHIRNVLALKPSGYVLKPVSKNELLKRISDVLGEFDLSSFL